MLISIMVATIWVFVFRQMGSDSNDIAKIMESDRIATFNQQFLQYNGRGIGTLQNKPLNIHDVITIVNISKDNDEKDDFVHVPVMFNGSDLTSLNDSDLESFMLNTVNSGSYTGDNSTNYKKFSCEVTQSDIDSRFYKVIIKPLN